MGEMKDSGISWIGNIPIEWKVYPLKYSFTFVAGATPDSTNVDLWDGEILWITPADYKTKDIYVSGGSRNLSELGYKSCSTHMLPIGTIVVSKRAPIGSVAITANPLCTNQGCLGLVQKYNNISEKYYYYLLSIYDDVLNLYGSGTTFKEISATVFSNIAVANPPYSQQKAIADFLDIKCSEIDALSDDIQSEIDTLEAYKRSVIAEAVTKGLDKNAPMKDSGLPWVGKVPQHWMIEKVKYHLTRKETKNQPDKQVLSVYREYGVIPKDSRDDNHNVTSEDTSKYKYVKQGNLVINKMKAWQGSMGVSDYEGIVSPAYFIYHFTDNLLVPKYLHYLFRSCYKDEFRRISGGIREGQWDLDPNEFANTMVLLPPVQEQKEIIQVIDGKTNEIEATIAKKKEQLEILADYKKSLIYEYVTGKKEVPTNG